MSIMSPPDCSPEEQVVIEELKRRAMDCVTPRMLEDNYLFYRFAKARNFNLAQAEYMIRKHICWRKEFEVDTMMTDYKPLEVYVKYLAVTNLCFDKEECSVLYVDCKFMDIKGLWNCAPKKDILQYLVYFIERSKDLVLKRYKKFGKHAITVIFDLENLPYGTATHMKTIQYVLYFLKAYVDNFPETLRYAYFINAPVCFLWMFSILKQVLPLTVIQKVKIHGTDGWREELLKLIDADVLPAFLGGNKTDPDGNPLCKTFIHRGKPIPKSYYMANGRKNSNTDLEKLTILPCSKKDINFEVKEVNSNLEWECDVKSKDIDFSLLFKGEAMDPVELIPKYRLETCNESEKGFFQCEKIGTYTILLDNSYSWIAPKEVYFRAELNPPKRRN